MRAGEVLGSRYEIEALAGAGGMGAVYRARDRSSGEVVALKVLAPGAETDERGRGLLPAAAEERFGREARVLAQLEHPGIVRYVAHGFTPAGAPYLVMEWVEGETLEQRLRRAPLADDDALACCEAVAEALGYVHSAGIVHRDVKPSNVMLAPGGRIRLVDFGVARLAPAASAVSLSGAIIGTLRYMAPEQAGGEAEVGPPADVHGLGACIYRALTGRAPYDADDAASVLGKLFLEDAPRLADARPDVAPEVCAVVDRMLAKAADARFPDGAAAGEALAEARRATRAAPASQLPPSRATLTLAERRVASVIAVVLAGSDAKDAARAAVAPFGAQVAAVDAQTLVATLATRAEVREQAAQAVRCAGALAAACPGARIVVATGRSEVKGTARVGDAIDRALRRVREAAVGIALDDVTAGLVAGKVDAADGADAPRVLLGRARPCVGRERELALLEGVLDDAVARSVSKAALVVGDAGVGKTRLLHELARGFAARGFEPWLARTDAITAGSPFGMLAQLVHRAADIAEGEPEAARRDKIAARVARHVGAADAPRVAAFLGEICGARFDAARVPILRGARRDPQVMGDQMRRAWEDFVAAEARAHPVVLVLEDLHWGDLPSVKLVGDALAHARGLPLVAFALARPEVHRLFPNLWEGRGATVLALPPLSEESSAALASHVLGAEADAAAIARLVRHAQGNALFLEELIRAESEGRTGAFPETVLAMVHSRLEELDPECRRALRAASVFGQAFWMGGVRALLDDGAASTLDAVVGRLVARELVDARPLPKFPGESELFFRHEYVREAAYATLTERDRRGAHREAGAWLEAHGEGNALALAEHFERGGVATRAATFYLRATTQALEGHDFAGAVARAERGIACGPSEEGEGRFRLAQAEAMRWAGDTSGAVAAATVAARRFEADSASWFAAVSEAAMCAGIGGDYAAVEAWADRASSPPAGVEARQAWLACLCRIGAQLTHGDRLERARRVGALVQANSTADALADPVTAAWTHVLRSWLAYFDDELAVYLEGQEAAARAFEAAGDERGACREWINVGQAYLELSSYAACVDVTRTWCARAERAGLLSTAAVAHQNIGFALGWLGRHDEALVEIERALALHDVVQVPRHRTWCVIYRSFVARGSGDLVLAEKDARAVLAARPVPTVRAIALVALAGALLDQGRPTDAEGPAREAKSILDELGALESAESLLRLIHAEVVYAVGDVDGAREAIAAARGRVLARRVPPALRNEYLRCPINARTLALAARWLGA